MFKIQIYPEAEKEIKKIKKLYQDSIIEALKELQDDPLIGKPLTRELINHFAYKIGPYRLIYKIDSIGKTVKIISAGHRSVVYN